MRRTPLLLAGTAAAVLAVAAWQVPRLLDRSGDEDAASSFAQSWVAGTLAGQPWAAGVDDPAARVAAATARLTPAEADLPAGVTVGEVRRDGDRAQADLDVTWALPGGSTWAYRTQLELVRADGDWRPVSTPALVHPALTAERVLRVRTVPADRADVLDADGAPIVTERPVVVVGLEPRRAQDLAASVRRVAALLDVDGAALLERARAAAPTAFVDVITLRRDAYDDVRDRLRPVPGVVLREQTRALAPSAVFARALLGSVGPATAEVVQRSGGRVRGGDEVGLSGLQARYDEQLAGTAGVTVETVNAEGDPAPRVLQDTPPVAGQPLRLTLDVDVQRAADAALADVEKASALVAVRPSTGDVLAVANGGEGGSGYDRALLGQYPPGSTFKVASTLALLGEGLSPDDVVPCPATVEVSGKSFKNAEAEVLGDVPFSLDFADSCNTAFVGSADLVTPEQLRAAAASLGYGPVDVGTEAFGGDVPTGGDAVDHAAAMIGQGSVLASPLAVAVASGTVAEGRLHPPRLLADAPAAPAGEPLPATAVSDLRDLMRGVVTRGTGHRGARRPRRAGVGQDRHRGVRRGRPAAHPRLVHRLLRRPRLRGARRGRRLRRRDGRAGRRGLPAHAARGRVTAPAAPRRADLAVPAVVAVWVLVVLGLDTVATLPAQRLLGAGTWLLLALLLRGESRATRVQVAVVVVVRVGRGVRVRRLARRLRVPAGERARPSSRPGHGLVYLAALCLGRSAWALAPRPCLPGDDAGRSAAPGRSGGCCCRRARTCSARSGTSACWRSPAGAAARCCTPRPSSS